MMEFSIFFAFIIFFCLYSYMCSKNTLQNSNVGISIDFCFMQHFPGSRATVFQMTRKRIRSYLISNQSGVKEGPGYASSVLVKVIQM